MSNDIITIETLSEIVPIEVFKKGGINPILDAIRAEVQGIVPDTSTAKGRSAKAQAEQAKRDKIAAEERAKVQAEDAEIARVAAEKQAVINAKVAAAEAEAKIIAKQIADNAAIEKAESERLADRQHIGNIRGEVKLAFVGLGLTEDQAKMVVMAISKKAIPHVKITY